MYPYARCITYMYSNVDLSLRIEYQIHLFYMYSNIYILMYEIPESIQMCK